MKLGMSGAVMGPLVKSGTARELEALPLRARRRKDGRFLSIGIGLVASERLDLRRRMGGGAPRAVGAMFSFRLKAGVWGLGGAKGRYVLGVGVVARSPMGSSDIAKGEPGARAAGRAGEAQGDGAGEEVGVRSTSREARGGARRPEEKMEEYSDARRAWNDISLRVVRSVSRIEGLKKVSSGSDNDRAK